MAEINEPVQLSGRDAAGCLFWLAVNVLWFGAIAFGLYLLVRFIKWAWTN